MNQSATTTWSPMVSGPEDDFASFLEFGDLQLNFPTFDEEQQTVAGGQAGPIPGLNTTMATEVGMVAMKEGEIQQQIDPNLAAMRLSPQDLRELHGASESSMDLSIQAQMFHQQQLNYHQQRLMQGHYHRQGMVPPTPNSLEMHGQPRSYPQMDPQARAMYEHYARKQQDHMVFTPLVSPAVTPVDTQFRVQEYTMLGEYFSPLTSPALEAQNRPVQRSVYGEIRSDTSDTTSPVEMDIDQSTSMLLTNSAALRKSKRKSTTGSTKPPGRSVRQSPAMKPQSRRKQASSAIIPPKEVAEIIEDARRSKQHGTVQSGTGKLALPYGQDSSEAESVSPESFSEILMPPPATPRPGSVGRSPYLKARGSQSAPMRPISDLPATPASLMRIQKTTANGAQEIQELKQSNSLAEAEMEQIMEGITLPESGGTKPTLPTLDTTHRYDDETTPTLSAKSTLASASTPVSCTVLPSPRVGSTMVSPGDTATGKRGEAKANPRGGRKRNSTTTSQASPAIRPKISPSIKPLLPEGTTINAETSALLLASKSNYQNILEGTNLPGVSYPEALSTNLTSKRTSHKIAEQGRRNRINNALQEIASLLPPQTPQMSGTTSVSSNDDNAALRSMMNGTAAQQSNSKASTVEMAIEYIRSLQNELKEVKGKLEAVEKKLDGSLTSGAVQA
ncbi:hypothetical protein MMC26_003039 [Xylographa opegraphella]|nr:hypothetical protein [Xylographa opegraphella]